MDDGKSWASRGYKLLSRPENEAQIYYRMIGDKVKTHVALRLPKGKKTIVSLNTAEKWLINRLKELGEINEI